MENYETEARLFRTLMHPVRLALLDLLRDGEACVCHLEAALGYRQAYISQQLSVLREAGLVQDRREGVNIYYRVIEPRVFVVVDAAQTVAGQGRRGARRKVPRAEACPCPKCNAAAEKAAA